MNACALIFDCDGTLADTLPAHFESFAIALHSFSIEFDRAWFYQHCGLSACEMLVQFNRQFGYQLDVDAIDRSRQQQFYQLVHQIRPIEPIAAIARNHAGQVPIALASGGDRSVVEATLEAIGMRTDFDAIVCRNDVQRGKPAPDIFLLASERLGVSPTDCLVYEDSDTGLEAARRAGMRSIDVRKVLI
ncbi:MAG: HAD family phosphatase [Microcoleus sp. SIO2G3]|nr:HAD family phosphatase [Microcoleus sp. SIO2G3]